MQAPALQCVTLSGEGSGGGGRGGAFVPGDGQWEPERAGTEFKLWPSCFRGAQLLLSTPVRFQGDAVFAGQLSVKAVGDGKMQSSCITVNGNFTLQPEAHLSLQGCQNQAEAGNGGCLHVEGDAELRGGHLQLNGCTASKGEGGGVVVGGRIPAFAALPYIERRRLCTRAHRGLSDACCCFCAAVTVAGALQSRTATIDAEGCHARYGGGGGGAGRDSHH